MNGSQYGRSKRLLATFVSSLGARRLMEAIKKSHQKPRFGRSYQPRWAVIGELHRQVVRNILVLSKSSGQSRADVDVIALRCMPTLTVLMFERGWGPPNAFPADDSCRAMTER